MTKQDLEQYCSAMRDLFLSEGWKWLVADCTDAVQTLDNIDVIATEAQLHQAKGAKTMAQRILSLPESIEQLEAEMEHEDADD